ncbi:MAG TPA: glycosyltransferase family 2 protein [Bacteroidia bacterium]|nr:glycosyltransferase family 2 protein [Bacteroidia bacterium]
MQGISYIISTHNRPGLVNTAICSVIEESRNVPGINTELIIVDDNSDCAFTPNKNDLPEYKGTISIVRTTKTMGVSKARNLGLENAAHPYILFLDDDDTSFPDRSKALYPLIQNSGYSFITGKSVMRSGKNTLIIPEGDSAALTPHVYLNSFPHINSVIWRKNDLLKAGGMDEALPYFGEHLAALKLLLNGYTAFHTPETVSAFEYQDGGLTLESHQNNRFHDNSVALFTTLLNYSLHHPAFRNTCMNVLKMMAVNKLQNFNDLIKLLSANQKSDCAEVLPL